MKTEIKPLYAGIILSIVVVCIGWFFYRVAGNLGGLPYGAVGNAGPFSPGGAAVGQGGTAGRSAPEKPEKKP
jgi:hypothetical protein